MNKIKFIVLYKIAEKDEKLLHSSLTAYYSKCL